MKVLIDNTPLYLEKCGVERYARNLITHLQKIDQKDFHFDSFPLRKIFELYTKLPVDILVKYNATSPVGFISLSKMFSFCNRIIEDLNKEIKVGQDSFGKKGKREIIRLLKNILSEINHYFYEDITTKIFINDNEIYHALYAVYPERIYDNKIKRVFTVHDIIPFRRPDLIPEGINKAHNLHMKQIKKLNKEDLVITVSEFSKQDICNFNPQLNPDNVHVTYLAAESSFFHESSKDKINIVKEKCNINKDTPYIIASLTRDLKKNLKGTLAAFQEIVESKEAPELHLVLSGSYKTADFSLIRNLPREVQDNIILSDFLSDEELSALYSDAIGFCFPSLYEGFGIPVLEAMQSGCPVITSKVTSLLEVAGNSALLCDPEDSTSIAQAILNLWKSWQLREELREKGFQQAQKFSWDICAQQTLQAYRTLLR